MARNYPDASHHCYAWRIGHTAPRELATDAGEPAGTAGRPILGEIRRRELTNTLVFVVRYFGGKKLGVRGLIDAYGTCAAQVLDRSGSVRRTPRLTFIACPVPQHLNVFINRVLRLTGDKKGLEIRKGSWEVQFSAPLSQREQALGLLEKAIREKIIESYREGHSP